MKKFRYIGLVMGLVILLSSSTQAQYYYTSYGYAQDWYLPKYVQHSIYDHYYGYEIAHVERYKKHGHTNFNVLLHRNGWFVELRYDDHGNIYKTIHHKWHYPLVAHRCSNNCGYHHGYYKVHYPKYHQKHKHHGPKDHGKKYDKKVYHGKKHDKGHKKEHDFYVNIYIEKQHNPDVHISQPAHQVNIAHQQQSRRGTIQIPQAARDTKEYKREEHTKKEQRSKSRANYTRPTTGNNSSARLTAHRGGSRTSRQR